MVLAKSIPAAMVVVSTAITLLLGEALVRFVVNPGDFLLATLSEHPVLGHRIKPRTTGHDALGFRNAAVLERAGVVALGDSMTYGFGAARDESWPQQFGVLLGEPVYNMAVGGYGPLEYLYLARHEAKKLRPRLLIVGFYFGNDLIDAYSGVHRKPYWHSWRETGSEDPGESAYERAWDTESTKPFAALRDWLSRNSVLYSMVRLTVLQPLASRERDRSDSSVRTIFTPQLRLAALEPGLPSVQQGLRITKRAFIALQKDAVDQGIDLFVVLIPTKERAYCRYLEDTGDPMPITLARLCDAEERIKHDLAQFLAANAIRHVDVTAAMEEQIRKQVQVYPTDSDGHPKAAGYSVIARAVYESVRRPEPKK